MIASLALALSLASASRASDFLEALHRADARDAKDPERVEFATRAIRAWKPSDGGALLAAAHFRRGEGEFEGFDDAAAEGDFAKALELDARNDRALLLRARARLRLGRGAGAESDFIDYTERHPEDGEGWLGLAEARVGRGLPRADRPALEAAERAAKLLPEGDPRPRLAEGRAHLAADRPLKALDSFEAAAASARDLLPDVLAWRARAKAELGDARGARDDDGRAAEAFQRRLDDRRRANAPQPAVAAVKGDLAEVRFRRGRAEETLARIEDAREDYRLACELGHAAACARAEALAPRSAAPAPKPKKRPYRPNPEGDSGTRIYAN